MSDRQVIEAQIKKKLAELASLEERLRSTKIYIRALEDVLRQVARDKSSSRPLATQSESEVALRAGSSVARAREVILSRGSPIHIDDLSDALGRERTREARASLTGSLSAYVRRGEVFTRPAPSTYGLVELSHFDAPRGATEPPHGFGRVTGPMVEDEANSV